MICNYCEGFGYIVDPMPPVNCPACRGRGIIGWQWWADFKWNVAMFNLELTVKILKLLGWNKWT